MKFTASSEKFFEDRIPGVKVPPGHWVEKKGGEISCASSGDFLLIQISASGFYSIVSFWTLRDRNLPFQALGRESCQCTLSIDNYGHVCGQTVR